MPAILRIFPYQTDASLTDIGSTESYGQGAGRSGATPATRCRADLVGECADAVMHDEAGHDDGSGYGYHFQCCLHICVFNGRGR